VPNGSFSMGRAKQKGWNAMCRLIGFASPEPTTLADMVGDLQCSTFQHMSRLHADGWGTMSLNSAGQIESLRIATPGQDDSALTSAMVDQASLARVVHLRMATDGMAIRLENSHPFVTDGIGLAHNGSIVPTDRLRSTLSPEILADVRGDTDSELYLAAIRQSVASGLSLADAVFDTVRWLRDEYPKSSLNALVMSRREFVAVHASSFSTPPLADFEASGLSRDDLPLDHVDSYYTLSYLRRANGAVAFASTGIDRQGWTALTAESVSSVDLRSFEFVTRTLEPSHQPVS
jgi:glutamine amidotransferase